MVYHTESQRRARRYRRRQRRPILIPMEGLIPRRITSRDRWALKQARKRHHPRPITRSWNGRERR